MIEPPYLGEAKEAGTLRKPFVMQRGERKTIIDSGVCIQIYYAETSDRYGKMVTRRVTTRDGHTTDEIFDPPIIEIGLPRLPPSCALGALADGAAEGCKTRLSAAARRARRRERLDKRRLQSALGGYARKRKSDED
jgi:hypothetical protein